MEITDILAAIFVVLALVIAIFSTNIRNALNNDLLLFIIEAGLLIGVIALAVIGQTISRS
ncbi:MAG: hypothetical protein ACFFB5_04885 [Promethearchaeota archaeon]